MIHFVPLTAIVDYGIVVRCSRLQWGTCRRDCRIQEAKKASYPIGDALEDWKIFNRVVKKLGLKDKIANFDELRKEVLETVPNFSEINELPKKSLIKTNNIETSFFSEKIFVRELDYYYTNSISRSSKTMSECRQIRQKIKKDGTNN